ncbi:hypothetical protein [Catellatospora bangladeshensis]|uniref:hypothetical protein n=1 Tax=Catellatospora bangladeshensis TaxID=310355 RepID=UPI0019443ABD|nr:hypothetical protein [Catellatospora bangladeshensis]
MHTPGGERLAAVRCVKFANLTERATTPGVSFVWYGEGVRAGYAYRHFGEAFQDPRRCYGHAAYLQGNGEELHGHVDHLTFHPTGPPEGPPERIAVTGDWTETWLLEPDGLVTEYTALPGRIVTAGPWFDHFSVLEKAGTHGAGHRYMLSSGSWLGSGTWRGVPYLHLGTFIGDPTAPGSPVSFGAADICFQRGFCGQVRWGAMLLRPAARFPAGTLEVVGGWTEVWTPRRSRTPCALADVPVLPFRS